MRSVPLFKTQAEVNDAMSKIETSGYKEARGKQFSSIFFHLLAPYFFLKKIWYKIKRMG